MTFNFNPYNRVKLEGNGIGSGIGIGQGRGTLEERKKFRPDTGQDAFFISRVGASGGIAMGVVGFTVPRAQWSVCEYIG